MKRRSFLAGAAALVVSGCTKIGKTEWFGEVVDTAGRMHRFAHRTLAPRGALVPEYSTADISPEFRGNGTTQIDDPLYRAALDSGFADWRLKVRGLVEQPLSLSLADIRALPQRAQITRHDCVEGWSAIGEWTGPQLSTVLDAAKPLPNAKFVVFRCADRLNNGDYYESCDLDDAYHPQTIIAHLLNGEPLPEKNGAPLRMRVERHLGYKHAKYLTAIELVESYDALYRGEGGYWPDRGYQNYAGI